MRKWLVVVAAVLVTVTMGCGEAVPAELTPATTGEPAASLATTTTTTTTIPVATTTAVAGPVIVVPAGRVHRFEPTWTKSLRCVRIFQDEAGWVPHYVD